MNLAETPGFDDLRPETRIEVQDYYTRRRFYGHGYTGKTRRTAEKPKPWPQPWKTAPRMTRLPNGIGLVKTEWASRALADLSPSERQAATFHEDP